MTVIYNTYYSAISSGEIDLNKVNFSVIIVGNEYTPKEEDSINDITNIIERFDDILVEKDIVTLTMSEIIDKIILQISEESKNNSFGFVIYDTKTEKLCFYESLDNMNYGE